jgi:hypothetical protein
VLERRAIQGLFMFLRRAERPFGIPTHRDRFATTIGTYNQSLSAWRINFINPAADETSARLIARRDGHDIGMEGKVSDVHPFDGNARRSRQRPSTALPRDGTVTASLGNPTWSYSASGHPPASISRAKLRALRQ